MSQLTVRLSKGILVAAAVVISASAVQLAFGRDLGSQYPSASESSAVASSMTINRSAKANRDTLPSGSVTRMQTVLLHLNGLSDTSVLLRMPVAREADQQEAIGIKAPALLKPVNGKTAVACEPTVSVLTEVAKQLEPGRCVT